MVILTIIKDTEIGKELSRKLFLAYFYFFEVYLGVKTFVGSMITNNTNIMVHNSLSDLKNKFVSSIKNLNETILANCEDIIREKFMQL